MALRGYNGSDDLDALRNFVAASGLSHEELTCRVYCAMVALNQELKKRGRCRG